MENLNLSLNPTGISTISPIAGPEGLHLRSTLTSWTWGRSFRPKRQNGPGRSESSVYSIFSYIVNILLVESLVLPPTSFLNRWLSTNFNPLGHSAKLRHHSSPSNQNTIENPGAWHRHVGPLLLNTCLRYVGPLLLEPHVRSTWPKVSAFGPRETKPKSGWA
jgi:hypothetical protein